jgi:hypothetical protein
MGTWVKDVFVEHPDTGPSWPTYDNRFAKPNPCGFGSARLATLAFAPPPPQGLARSSRKAIYRKVLTPAIEGPDDWQNGEFREFFAEGA